MRLRRVGIAAAIVASVALGGPTADPASAVSMNPVPTPTGSGRFGGDVLVLANGNYVVADPLWDGPTMTDVGAVRLYDGTTNQLLTTLTGSEAGDAVGSDGVVEVGGSNVVVRSGSWRADRGAVTWMSGATGLDGAVTAANSLVGAAAGDEIGAGAVTALANGGYVVASPTWDASRGAVTWAASGGITVGSVSALNSLVGAAPGDAVGSGGVALLTNGNYVVASPDWASAGASEAGAVTWGSASAGVAGVVSAQNSIVGTSAGDRVGAVTALSNGNYVVSSATWSDAGQSAIGAARWADGATGATTGAISSANSIVGTDAGDGVGATVVSLTNGNYVVISPEWADGASPSVGAVTWSDGTAPTAAVVSAANSLVGSTAADRVGSAGVAALTNGDFVVASPAWDDGALTDGGAATWSGGVAATNVVGPVSAANSLTGAVAGSSVGEGVTALANGHALVRSPSWTDGVSAALGAVTWIDGAGPVSAVVSAANSLVGGTTGDRVGSGAVAALANGNAVVTSPTWSTDIGAATWIDGAIGLTGVVSDVNSLIGGTPGDLLGEDGVTELTDGNYLVGSSHWQLGAAEVGALTWASGATGRSGLVSAGNSLLGTTASDGVGADVIVLDGGRYAAVTNGFDNGAITDAGAVTSGPPGGVTGQINSTNSVIGGQADTSYRVAGRRTADRSILIGSNANVVSLLQLEDVNPPLIGPHPPVTAVAPAGAAGTAVTYSPPPAIDGHGAVTVACAPPPGSVFPLGVTTVVCTATDGAGLVASSSFSVTVTQAPDFVPLSPARLADTRPGFATVDGQFAGTGKLGANGVLHVVVAGRGGVASDAVAAALNVTVAAADAPGYLTVYPCGEQRPTASNLNYTAGATVPNAVVAKLGQGGMVCIFTQSAAQVIVDVNGAFPATTSLVPINPARLLETRPGLKTIDGQQQGVGLRAGGSTSAIRVIDRAGVPADASAVVVNVTVTGALAPGYVTVFPCGEEPPTASTLNVTPGATVANLAISKVGTNGNICVFTQSPTHLVIDIAGYFPRVTSYAPLVPARLLDTRPSFPTVDGSGQGIGRRPLGTVTTLQVLGRGGVPAGASSVVLNVTVTGPAAPGYVTAYPCGIDVPLASNLNFSTDQTVANAVVVRVGADGRVCLFNSQATHLIVDVTGSLLG